MRIEDLLNKEICKDLDALSAVDLGTDEYKIGTDAVGKLIDREIELRKLKIESRERIESRKAEEEFKTKKMKDDRIDRVVGYVLAIAGIVVPVCVTIWGTGVSLRFEEEGTVTTTAGRNYFNRMFPKK
jgi:hypothetical protein